MSAGRLVAAMVAVSAVVGASCSAADDPPAPKAAEPSATVSEPGQDDPAAPTTANEAPFFERGPVDEVFVLAEGRAGAAEVGYAGSLEDPASLVAGTQAAVPDGRGGVVFLVDDEVWWKGDEGAQPELIESPGRPVNLMGLRWVSGEPVVVVLIGDKLVGYDRGANELLYAFTGFGGEIADLDVDANIAAVIVDTADGAAVQRVDLSSGESRELMRSISPNRDRADLGAPLCEEIGE